jgi:transcriptional regulator with XRE-family HTH domain
MPVHAFPERLTFVLKALSMSRGRLASEVGVDKSLVGRWCSGVVTPSSPNLARLTEIIAARKPGFTLHSWDQDLTALAEAFGVPAPAAAPAAPVGDMFPFPLLSQPSAADMVRGADYEGIWRSTRPSSEMPGQFVHDHILLRREASGAMSFTLGAVKPS